MKEFNENHFILGETEFIRDVKTTRCYRLNELGKKVRISNQDFEEYQLEWQRRLAEGELEPETLNETVSMEQPEEIKAAEVSPEQAKSIEAETAAVQEVEPENKITDEHDERYHIAIRVRSGDDPSDVCDNMQTHLKLGKSVNLEGSGRLSVSNMILAVKNLESRLGFNIPVFLSFRKTYSHEYRKYLDIASIFIYPEYLTNKPEENNAVVAMHRIQQILDNWRMSMKKLAPTDGAAEADENQLAFPWCEGKSGDEKSVTHSE